MPLSEVNTKCRWKLYMTAFIVNLLYISTGCVLAWPSPALPMLEKFGYTDEQNSWIASIMALGASIGSLTIGLISSRFGRKATLYLNGGIFVISWLTLYFPKSMTVLCIGRFISGYAISITFNIIPVYITEIAQDDVRQAMTSPVEFFIGVGFILQYIFGSLLNYYQLQIASLLVVVAFLVPFTLVPESPFYLVSKGKEKKAMKVLSWLWNQDNNLNEEVVKIQNILSMDKAKGKTVRKIDLLKKKGYRRAFFIILFLLCAQQLTGTGVIGGYLLTLLSKAGLPFPLSRATIALSVTYTITSCAAPPLVRYFGTKNVFVASTFIVALCQGIFGVYMLLKRFGYDLTSYYLVPLLTFAVYFSSFAIGAGPLPMSITAELSPAEHRSLIICICSTSAWIVAMILLRWFYPSIEMFGVDSVFFSFSLSLFVTGIIIIIILPDTKSMSLLDVKNDLLDELTNNDERKNNDSSNDDSITLRNY